MSEAIQHRLQAGDKYDLPWSWDSLRPNLIEPLSNALVDWVLDYNENFVVRSSALIPKCWPAHRGLAREIAAIYSHWMAVFHSHGEEATPKSATYFYDQVLPGFQSRIRTWLGPKADECQAGSHPAAWNKDVAERVVEVAGHRAATLERLVSTYSSELAITRSAPPESPLSVEADAEQ